VDILLADLDLTARVRDFVIYVFAIVGGFVLGNLLTWILCRLIGKHVFKHRMPEPLERAFRVIGGILVAILVGFLLFRGWGFGGTGTGEGKEAGGPGPGKENPGKDKQPPSKSTIITESVVVTKFIVTIQAAKNAPKTFRFEGDTEAVDLNEAIKKLKSLRDISGSKLPSLEIRVYDNSSATSTPDVSSFRENADKLGFQSRFEVIKKPLE
jgi:hypothetical protein